MPKLTITEAVKVIPVSESKLRRDLKIGKLYPVKLTKKVKSILTRPNW